MADELPPAGAAPTPQFDGPVVPPQGGSGPVVAPPKDRRFRLRHMIILLLIMVVVGGAVAAAWWVGRMSSAKDSNAKQSTTAASADPQESFPADVVTLDPAHDYGDKYADGLLPVGDSKYVTTGAQKGSLYMCKANFVPASQAGAQTRGPWFVNNNTQWDLNKKVQVQGKVMWEQKVSITVKDGLRVVTTNDLPDHHTGVFPVASSDPAAAYDRNPNSIKDQSLVYSLTANPTAGTPQCMGGEVGVMLTGVALFNAFDAGGRDAGAWEVQDSCDGHPQSAGEYHYHTLSRCIKDMSVHTVIGWALDGFPITGPKVGDKNYLTTSDLDACHGLVSDITLDGKTVRSYHYVMTQDFPYSASCFRSKAADPPGQHEQGGQNSQSGGGGQTQTGQGGGQSPQQGPPSSGPPPAGPRPPDAP